METDIKNKIDRILKLKEYAGEDKVISSLEYQELIKDIPKGKKMMSGHIATLDKDLKGFEEGELVVLSGATGHGKTTLATTITQGLLADEIMSLWFSFEVRPAQFFAKFPQLPLFYLPKTLKDHNVPWIEQRIIEAKLKYGIRAVFIDHLHFLVDMFRIKNPSLEIGLIMRTLKIMAIQHEIVIFLCAHLMKTKLEEEPDNDTLRDSSFIAQESDIVIMIWRNKDKNTGEFNHYPTLKITKNRREGAIGKKIKLKYENGVLQEVTDMYQGYEPPRSYAS